jgi:putrescine aminotransferase
MSPDTTIADEAVGSRARPAEAPQDASEVVELYRRHVNSGLARLANMLNMPVETRSQGCLVYDAHDKAYLDCGGYGVFITGHCHPVVVDAVRRQLERHPLATRMLLSPELAYAAQALARVTPGDLNYVCFASSGAEAVEIGLKIARLNGKTRLIATEGGFHGKTLGALSIGGRARYREPFLPLLPDVEFVPFGDASALRTALMRDGERTCVILEPVQGEAGVIIPPPGYLRDVQGLCREHGALLVLDEIQSGLGRLGTWWGADRDDVEPDVMLVGKGLSGGCVPVAAAVATPAAYAALNRDPFLHSSTFAGNPLAMAAARAAVEVIDNENLVERARDIGEKLLASLRRVFEEDCPGLAREVRGVGLLIGVEFPADHLAGDFLLELLKRRVIVSTSLSAHRVVRFTPPAVLNEAQIEWLLGAVSEAAVAVARRKT